MESGGRQDVSARWISATGLEVNAVLWSSGTNLKYYFVVPQGRFASRCPEYRATLSLM